MSKVYKKIIALFLCLSMVFATACGGAGKDSSDNGKSSDTNEKKEQVKVTMVTDQGGINDKSFNQSAYEGFENAKKEGWLDYRYIESHKEAEYAPNMETALDDESDVIFTIGYALFKATDGAAKENTDQKYAIIDNANVEKRPNMIGVLFADNENSFLVGYIAGMTTKTNKVGFVGGMKSDVIDRFEYGFKAGVKEAERQKKQPIEFQSQYADSYAAPDKGKSIANLMYQKGVDVIFHAAGGTGYGVIQAAIDNNKYVIGVDRDQSADAPKNMLVSTVKGVNVAVQKISKNIKDGKFEGGSTVTYSLKDGDAVDIAYANNDLVAQDVKDKVESLKNDIKEGKIKVPQNEKEFTEFGFDK